jgi:hypothetical protein
VVEFALVLPILLMVTLAVVQVGLIARDQLMVVQASRAGARGLLLHLCLWLPQGLRPPADVGAGLDVTQWANLLDRRTLR